MPNKGVLTQLNVSEFLNGNMETLHARHLWELSRPNLTSLKISTFGERTSTKGVYRRFKNLPSTLFP